MSGAKNAVYTREYNRLLILRHLRQQPASRAELARQTGLTRAAISIITEELMDDGFIKESSHPADHSRGRTPVLLKLHPDGAYAVGVCLTRQECRVGLCDFRGRLLGSCAFFFWSVLMAGVWLFRLIFFFINVYPINSPSGKHRKKIKPDNQILNYKPFCSNFCVNSIN